MCLFSQQQEDDYGEGEDDAEVQQECLHKFSTRDYIMEPSIFNTLKRCVKAPPSPPNGTTSEFPEYSSRHRECMCFLLQSAYTKSPPLICAYLMNLRVLTHLFLSRYFQAGGSPENVIHLLSENYTAVAQTVNLLAEWLIQTGALGVGGLPTCLLSPLLVVDL